MSATFENIMDRVEHCYTAKPCVECKYDKRDFPHCVGRLLSDVRFFYKELESRLAQAERERDAAVHDMKSVDEKYEVLKSMIDDVVFRHEPYSMYLDFREAADAMIEHEHEDVWRGVYPANAKEAASS